MGDRDETITRDLSFKLCPFAQAITASLTLDTIFIYNIFMIYKNVMEYNENTSGNFDYAVARI